MKIKRFIPLLIIVSCLAILVGAHYYSIQQSIVNTADSPRDYMGAPCPDSDPAGLFTKDCTAQPGNQ